MQSSFYYEQNEFWQHAPSEIANDLFQNLRVLTITELKTNNMILFVKFIIFATSICNNFMFTSIDNWHMHYMIQNVSIAHDTHKNNNTIAWMKWIIILSRY